MIPLPVSKASKSRPRMRGVGRSGHEISVTDIYSLAGRGPDELFTASGRKFVLFPWRR